MEDPFKLIRDTRVFEQFIPATPQRCYCCRDCMRPLDPFLCCDTPDMEIVCKGCYTKSYSVTSDWCNMSGGDALKVTGVVMNIS